MELIAEIFISKENFLSAVHFNLAIKQKEREKSHQKRVAIINSILKCSLKA